MRTKVVAWLRSTVEKRFKVAEVRKMGHCALIGSEDPFNI